MVKYSKKNGARYFDRRLLNLIFGKKTRRPDEECWEMAKFVSGTIIGSSFEDKWYDDFCVFMREFAGTPWKYFKVWWNDERRAGGWPVVENRDGKPHFAWFRKGVRVSDWEEMTR
jgi:hypothetical protein